MAWLERTEEHSDTEAEGEPPQQRAHPYTEHQDRRAPESRFGPAEADRGKDGEEGKNCDRVGQGQRVGRGVVPRQTTGSGGEATAACGPARTLRPPTMRRKQAPPNRSHP